MSSDRKVSQVGSPSPELRSYFVLGEHLQFMENQMIEYKNFIYPFDGQRKQILKEVICSFLNTKGGFLFLGVDDQGHEIRGVQLTLSQKDNLRLDVIEIVERSFHPKVEMMENPLVRVNFIPIKNGGKVVPGKWVIRIVVERGNELYVCMDNGCFLGYKRMDGRKVTLRDKELYDEIVRYAQNRRIFPNEKLVYEVEIEKGEDVFDFRKNKNQFEGDKEDLITKKIMKDEFVFFLHLFSNESLYKEMLVNLINSNSKGIANQYQINIRDRTIECEQFVAFKEIKDIIRSKREILDEIKMFKSISVKKNGKLIYKYGEVVPNFSKEKKQVDSEKPCTGREVMICIDNFEQSQMDNLTSSIQKLFQQFAIKEKQTVIKSMAIFIIFCSRLQAVIFKKEFLKLKPKSLFGAKIWLSHCNDSILIDMKDQEFLGDILNQVKIAKVKSTVTHFSSYLEGIELYTQLAEVIQNLQLKEAKLVWL